MIDDTTMRRKNDVVIATILEKVHNIELRITEILDNCKCHKSNMETIKDKLILKCDINNFQNFYEKEFKPLEKQVYKIVIVWGVIISLLSVITPVVSHIIQRMFIK